MISTKFPNVRGLIIDMDGVLWQDTLPIGDLPSIFQRFDELNLKYILATNNATRTIREYQEKLADFGVHLKAEQIIGSVEAVGTYLEERYPQGASVYVVGEPGFKQTLSHHNMRIVDESEKSADVVAVGLDFGVTYNKLKHASLLIQSGSEFVGANPDNTFPTPEGFIPGAGTLIGALEIATGKKATIIGKPEPLLFQIALKRLGLAPKEALVIGDRLETDIAGAQAAGIHTALVLSGASSYEEANAFIPKPEIIAKDLTELIN